MSYVDFFNLPLPSENEAKYTKMAELFAEVMKDYGLVNGYEAISDDLPKGEVTDFYKAVGAKDGEVVVAACYVWPDKETRDRAWNEGMKDPRLADMMNPKDPTFDGKRMFWGGFRSILEI